MSGVYLPCMNPNCKSFGHSHPNCRCWGTAGSGTNVHNVAQVSGKPGEGGAGIKYFASGGAVSHYCGSNQRHDPDCEYHAQEPSKFVNPDIAVPLILAHIGAGGLLGKEKEGLYSDYGTSEHINNMKNGSRRIKNALDALFNGGAVDENGSSKDDIEKIKDFIANGALNKQMADAQFSSTEPEQFAEGGEVKEDHSFSQVFPTHNILLNAARGRVNQYLNAHRPQENMPKLAFDDYQKDPVKEKHYERAIGVAQNPLSVLSHIKSGQITPEHILHLNGMYPELKSHLDKEITQKIVESQVNKEKPNYKTRQGLSAFLGTPLSGELAQPNIMAAQMSFMANKQPPQQPGPQKNKKSTSSLSKASDDYWTGDQAAERRQTAER